VPGRQPGLGLGFRHLIPVFLAAGHRVVVPICRAGAAVTSPKAPGPQRRLAPAAVAEWVEALDVRHAVLLGQGDAARLGLAVASQQPQRFAGAWLHDAWPADALPLTWSDWQLQAARKPRWPVGRSSSRRGAGPLGGGTGRIRCPVCGGRPPRGTAGWRHSAAPPCPLCRPLLHDWLAQGRCWVTRTPQARCSTRCAAHPNTKPPGSRCCLRWPVPAGLASNPGLDWGRSQADGGARRAVEYFRP
jgi:tRNA(adenine34) deaminase